MERVKRVEAHRVERADQRVGVKEINTLNT